MVGGASGSFIADVHRKAALFDGQAELAAGCFSSKFERTLETGAKLGLDQERLYRDHNEMAQKEAAREDGIDFAIIATPNYAHYPAAKAFLENGIHVVCDKPLTLKVEEAEELVRLAEEKGLLFCVTYAYSQYPAVKQAQMMVKNGDIGEIQVVVAEYPQGWLATPWNRRGTSRRPGAPILRSLAFPTAWVTLAPTLKTPSLISPAWRLTNCAPVWTFSAATSASWIPMPTFW